jgi:hypothetical protein
MGPETGTTQRERTMSDPNQAPQSLPSSYGECLRCGTELSPVGIEKFRVGGTSGGWQLLFGGLAEVGEGTLDIEVFACPDCRKIELRVPVR